MTRGSGLAPVMGSTSMIKKSTAANTDGLINCLLQPGLFYHRIQKSMREEFNPLIKSCATRTVPAAKTKSIGLQADALVPYFLLAIWTVLS
jgi:hypothetical protein